VCELCGAEIERGKEVELVENGEPVGFICRACARETRKKRTKYVAEWGAV